MNDDALARRVRRLALAWTALLALMLTSLGSAYLPLGRWNVVIGLAIAALKCAIVLQSFMSLRRAHALLRVAAAAGVFTLALLFGLSEVDYATRPADPAAMQQPQQLGPLRQGGAIR
jgi:cytochrome c oxidase subunit 4